MRAPMTRIVLPIKKTAGEILAGRFIGLSRDQPMISFSVAEGRITAAILAGSVW